MTYPKVSEIKRNTLRHDRGGYMTHCPYQGRAYSYVVALQGLERFTVFCPPCAHERGMTLEAAGSQRCGWAPLVGGDCHDCGRSV